MRSTWQCSRIVNGRRPTSNFANMLMSLKARRQPLKVKRPLSTSRDPMECNLKSVPSFPTPSCFILWSMLCAAGYFDQRKKSPTQKTGEARLSSDRSGSVNDVRKTRSAVRSVKQSDSNRRRKSLGLSSLVTVSITVMGRSHRPRGRDKTALSRRVGGVNKPLRIGANQAQADQGRLRPYRTTLRAYKNS